MKNTINCLKTDIKKSIFSMGFLICSLSVFLLCFSSVIYTESWSGKEFTALEIIFSKTDNFFFEFSSQNIIRMSVNPYITLFLPVLSSIPFVTSFCAERIGGNMRFIIIRTGKIKYCISKYITSIVSGALIVLTGFILYSIVIITKFGFDGNLLDWLKTFTGISIYGAVSVFPAFILSSFIKNKYMICCFPFIFMHFYYTFITKVQSWLSSKDKLEYIFKISFLWVSDLTNIMFSKDIRAVLFYTATAILSFFCFYIIMNRRIDYGQ